MRSIKIVDGDIKFNNLGRMEFVYDNDLTIQSLNLRLKTLRGSLFYNEEYGHPFFKGRITIESITVFLKDTLLDDERVNDIEIIDFNVSQSFKVDVSALIYLNSGESIEGILNI